MSENWKCKLFGHKKVWEHLMHGSSAYCARCRITLDHGDYGKGFPNKWWLAHLANKIFVCSAIGHALSYSEDPHLWGAHCLRCGGSFERFHKETLKDHWPLDTL